MQWTTLGLIKINGEITSETILRVFCGLDCFHIQIPKERKVIIRTSQPTTEIQQKLVFSKSLQNCRSKFKSLTDIKIISIKIWQWTNLLVTALPEVFIFMQVFVSEWSVFSSLKFLFLQLVLNLQSCKNSCLCDTLSLFSDFFVSIKISAPSVNTGRAHEWNTLRFRLFSSYFWIRT